MKKPAFTVADYLLTRLKEIGVDDLFGVVGDFVLSFFQFVEKSKVRMICTCNELNAAYAADGYARVHGIGGLVTTYMVGELSAINGVGGAFAENLPVIHIGGCPAVNDYRDKRPLHHTIGDYEVPLKMYQMVTVASTILKDPETAASEIDRVLQACLLHRRPVYIGIPSSMVVTPCKRPTSRLKIPARKKSCPKQLSEALHEAVSMLKQAKKPVIVADFELDRFHLEKEFETLLKKSGFPYATQILGKTVLSETHPQYIGIYEGNRTRPEIKKRVEDADCILALGIKVTDFNSGGFTAHFASHKTIMANIDRVKIKHHIYDKINLQEFMDGLSAKLTRKKIPIQNPRLQSYTPQKGKKLTIQRFFDRMESYLPDNSIAVAETGSALFACAEILMPKGATFLAQTFYGSIGYTVGAALGAAIGAPKRRVLLFVGDGSFQLTCQDVSTMIRYKTNPIIFLINNDGYLVERMIGEGSFNDLQPWKYHKLTEVFSGGWGCAVKTEDELEKALAKAEKCKELSFIEVMIGKWDSPASMTKAGAAMAKTNYVLS